MQQARHNRRLSVFGWNNYSVFGSFHVVENVAKLNRRKVRFGLVQNLGSSVQFWVLKLFRITKLRYSRRSAQYILVFGKKN